MTEQKLKKLYSVPEMKDYGTLKDVTAAGTCWCKTICLINCYSDVLADPDDLGYPDGGGTCPRKT